MPDGKCLDFLTVFLGVFFASRSSPFISLSIWK